MPARARECEIRITKKPVDYKAMLNHQQAPPIPRRHSGSTFDQQLEISCQGLQLLPQLHSRAAFLQP